MRAEGEKYTEKCLQNKGLKVGCRILGNPSPTTPKEPQEPRRTQGEKLHREMSPSKGFTGSSRSLGFHAPRHPKKPLRRRAEGAKLRTRVPGSERGIRGNPDNRPPPGEQRTQGSTGIKSTQIKGLHKCSGRNPGFSDIQAPGHPEPRESRQQNQTAKCLQKQRFKEGYQILGANASLGSNYCNTFQLKRNSYNDMLILWNVFGSRCYQII